MTAKEKKSKFARILREVEPVKGRIAGACALSLVSSGIMMGMDFQIHSCGPLWLFGSKLKK